MTEQEFKNLANEHLFAMEIEVLGQEHSELKIFGLDKLYEAINYTHCCTELKDLDSDNFEDWLIVNGYTVYKDHYIKGDQVFFESDLIQKYNDEVMNL
jgi:hypothetical protein